MFPSRIILSRKGFDGTAGGCPSPIFPDGTMFSIPIPENQQHKVRTRFEDLGVQGGVRLPQRLRTSSQREIALTGPVHLDPDIRPGLRSNLALRKCADTLLYGQDNASQTHLANEGVSTGDLFLFFGLFRDAALDDTDAAFVRSAKPKHVLWGWLQIGQMHPLQERDVPEGLKWAGHHPHLDYRNRANNYIYVGAPKLSFISHVNGAGIFEKYDDALCLTSRGEDRCSFWTLPAFFGSAGMTFHDFSKWTRQGDKICGQSVGRGQEFVMRTGGFEKQARTWLESIFKHAKKAN
jgi:hypothetical protein